MTVNAEGMSPAQKRILAEHLALRPLGSTTSGSVAAMPNHCSPKPLTDPTRGPLWSGWGVDAGNSRFQPAPAAGLAAADVPKLKLKWAFGFPNGTSAFAQPAVAGGRLFVGSDNGYVYALDAATGCSLLVISGAGGHSHGDQHRIHRHGCCSEIRDLFRRREGICLRGRR